MPTETKSLEKSSKGSGREAAGVKAAHPGPTSGSLLTTAGNLALQRVSAPRFQRKARINRSSDLCEEEADRVSQHVLTLISAPMVQRKCACGGVGECDECKRKAAVQSETIRRRTDLAVQRFSFVDDAPSPADSTSTTDTPATTDNPTATGNSAAAPAASPGLIVEDNATDLGVGQMNKSEFLGQLRSPVIDAAQSALQGTVWSSLGSVAIDPWFRQYSYQSAGQLERTIQQSVPGSAGVTIAGAYIPLISARVQSAVGEWARTGKVPSGVPAGLPGMGAGVLNAASSLAQSGPDALLNVASAVGGAVSDVAQGVSDAVSSIGSGISSAAQSVGDTISDIGGMLFKAKDGGARNADDPRAIQSQLGSGESLDGSLQSRMSSAFGYDFSSVRVHKDNRAAQLSSDLNARAFTIGSNVAFGANEYQPGTLIGDALIAHELAHVVQQGGATAQTQLEKGESQAGPLEDDADLSAVRAVATIWSGAKSGFANITKNAIPALKSGLKLQRCKGFEESQRKAEIGRARQFFKEYPGLKIDGELVDPDQTSDDEILKKYEKVQDWCRNNQHFGGDHRECMRDVVRQQQQREETTQAAVLPPPGTMLGRRGTQFTSKTLYESEGFRIDVENPNPGQRPGQIHYQTGDTKYLYDPVTKTFLGASKTLNKRLMSDPNVLQAIEKAMKMLGESE